MPADLQPSHKKIFSISGAKFECPRQEFSRGYQLQYQVASAKAPSAASMSSVTPHAAQRRLVRRPAAALPPRPPLDRRLAAGRVAPSPAASGVVLSRDGRVERLLNSPSFAKMRRDAPRFAEIRRAEPRSRRPGRRRASSSRGAPALMLGSYEYSSGGKAVERVARSASCARSHGAAAPCSLASCRSLLSPKFISRATVRLEGDAKGRQPPRTLLEGC